ncbi:TPA: 23S rRNA pseudouridine(955/2504/2580) synthase, partial [Pasteurella multocida]|nr:23S rRNA pseudouridine(955/2504/2580) synthase [Pasteurella multocida]
MNQKKDEKVINQAVKMLTISEDEAGQRIDNYLLAKLKGVPKSLIYRILRKGEVRVNKGRIKPEYKLQANDIVRVPPVRVSEKE